MRNHRLKQSILLAAGLTLVCSSASALNVVSFEYSSSVFHNPTESGSSSSTFPEPVRGDFQGVEDEGGPNIARSAGAATGFGLVGKIGESRPDENITDPGARNTVIYGAGAIAMDRTQVQTETIVTVQITNDTDFVARPFYDFQIFAGGVGINAPITTGVPSGPVIEDSGAMADSHDPCDASGGDLRLSECTQWLGASSALDDAIDGNGFEASVFFSAEVLDSPGALFGTQLFSGEITVNDPPPIPADIGDSLPFPYEATDIIRARSALGSDPSVLDAEGSYGLTNTFMDITQRPCDWTMFGDTADIGCGDQNYDYAWAEVLRTVALSALAPGESTYLRLISRAVAVSDQTCIGLFSSADAPCAVAHAYWADPAGLGRRGSNFAFDTDGTPPITGNYGPTQLLSNPDIVNGQVSFVPWNTDTNMPTGAAPIVQDPNGPSPPAGVPVPGSLWLIGLGLVAGWTRRLSRKG